MKQVVTYILGILFVASCGNKNSQSFREDKNVDKDATVYSVDELLANSSLLEGKEITVKGTVMHVCKQGGGRCFLMGSNEDFNIRIEAGERIGAFRQEQMGSDLTITGVFKEVKTAADAHNPAREHGGEDHDHDEEAEEAHRIIINAQEDAEIIYFIEGVRILKEEI